MQVFHQPVRAAVQRKRWLELDRGRERFAQLRWIFDQSNHPGVMKTPGKRGLMVIYSFAEPTEPRDDNRLLAASQRYQDAAHPSVRDDKTGTANVINHRLERQEDMALRSIWSYR